MDTKEIYTSYFSSKGYLTQTLSNVHIVESNFEKLKENNDYIAIVSPSSFFLLDSIYADICFKDALDRFYKENQTQDDLFNSISNIIKDETVEININDIEVLTEKNIETFNSQLYEAELMNEKINNSVEKYTQLNQEIQNMVSNNEKKIDVGGMIVGGIIGGTAGAILGGTPNNPSQPTYEPKITNNVKKEDFIETQEGYLLKFWFNSSVYSVSLTGLNDTLFYSVRRAQNNKLNGSNSASNNYTSNITNIHIPTKEEKISEYLKKAEIALSDSSTSKNALEYINEVLKLDSSNYIAWKLRMDSVWAISTYGNLFLDDISNAAAKSVEYAPTEMKDQISIEVYENLLIKCLNVLRMSMEGLDDSDSIKRTYDINSRINAFTAFSKTQQADKSNIELYDSMTISAINTLKSIPDEILAKSTSLAHLLGECAKQYEYQGEALIRRYKIYCCQLSTSYKEQRKDIKESLESRSSIAFEKATTLENQLKEENRNRYWEEHLDIKNKLLQDKEDAKSKLNEYKTSLNTLPESEQEKEIREKIKILQEKKSKISIFNRAERNQITNEIRTSEDKLSSILQQIKHKTDEIEQLMDEQNQIIKNIDIELTKDR